MRTSTGDLARYWTCPRLFNLVQTNEGLTAADQFTADCLGAVIARYFRLPPFRRPEADADTLVRECWRQAVGRCQRHGKQPFADRGTEQAHGQKLIRLARAFAASARLRGEPLVVGLEARCVLAAGCSLVGIIDTARIRPDGTIGVTLYRAHAVLERERMLEGILCQSGIAARFKLWVEEIEFIELEAGVETLLRLTRKGLEQWRQTASVKAAALSVDSEFAPVRGEHCTSCPAASLCTH